MIKSVVIKNFQSHKDTTIEFDPGVNVIKGSSSNGKSSILRALGYVINNKPIGMRHISYWAKHKKTITDECRVTINFDDCSVARIRGDINGYQIDDGKPLEAIESGVPQQVTDACRISEINIQKQLDAPFLLSSSSGQISQFFNRIMKLEDADEYQSAIESKRRKCNSDIKQVEEQIPILTASLNEFNWIAEAEVLLKELAEMDDNLQALNASINLLKKYSKDITDFTERVNASIFYKEAESILEMVANSIDKIQSVKKEKTSLTSIVDKITALQDSIFSEDTLTSASKYIAEIDTWKQSFQVQKTELAYMQEIVDKIQELSSTRIDPAIIDTDLIDSIDKTIDKADGIVAEIKAIKKSIDAIKNGEYERNKCISDLTKAEAEMPEVCPLCGKELG